VVDATATVCPPQAADSGDAARATLWASIPAVVGGTTTVIALADGRPELLDAVEQAGLSGIMAASTIAVEDLRSLPARVRERGAELVGLIAAGSAADRALRELPADELDAVVLVEPMLLPEVLTGRFREFTAPKLVITRREGPVTISDVRRHAVGKLMVRSFPSGPRQHLNAFKRESARDAALFVLRCCGNGSDHDEARQCELGRLIQSCPEGGER
jgi:hypothetical protein